MVEIACAMPPDEKALRKKTKMPGKEIIHSGHFMVSDIDEGRDDDDPNLATAGLPPSVSPGPVVLPPAVTPPSMPHVMTQHPKGPYPAGPAVSIDASLTKLFDCMTLAYSGKLTSPKWKTFKGLKLKLKDKIRLNNIIWRAWHLQFVSKRKPALCQFASPLDSDTHNKPEAVVLEGKYWKRKLSSVTAEYKKWRMYFYKERNNAYRNTDSEATAMDWDSRWPTWPNSNLSSASSTVEDDLFMDFNDTLFTLLPNQPFDFPNPREIAKAGFADFVQPGLVQLQPMLEDFMDTFEPLQDFLASKLPTLQEEGPEWLSWTADPSSPPLTTERFGTFAPATNQYGLSAQTSPPVVHDVSFSASVPEFSQRVGMTVQPGATGPARLQNVPGDAYLNPSVPLSTSTGPSRMQRRLPVMEPAAITVREVATCGIASVGDGRPDGTGSGSVFGFGTVPVGSSEQMDDSRIQTFPPSGRRISRVDDQTLNEVRRLSDEARSSPCENTEDFAPSLLSTALSHRGSGRLGTTATGLGTDVAYGTAPSTALNSLGAAITNLPKDGTGKPSSLLGALVGSKPTTEPVPLRRHSYTGLKPATSAAPRPHPLSVSSGLSPRGMTQAKGGRFAVPKVPLKQRVRSRSISSPQAGTPQILPPPPSQSVSMTNISFGASRQGAEMVVTAAPVAPLGGGLLQSTGGSPPLVGKPGPLVQSPSATVLPQNAVLAQLLTSGGPFPRADRCTQAAVATCATTSVSSTVTIIGPVQASTSPTPQTFVISPLTLATVTGVNDLQRSLLVGATSSMFGSQTTVTPSVTLPIRSSTVISDDTRGGSPLSGDGATVEPAQVKPVRPKCEDNRQQHKEHQRVCHINAEQKRRCNIKNGFDSLKHLLPSLSQNPNAKVSKASMLQKAAEYTRTLKLERQQRQEEAELLKQEIKQLNEAISVYQNLLPATGAPVSCQRANKMKSLFREYVQRRTLENWKFWIFSLLMEPLLESYSNVVSTSSIGELCKSILTWMDQSCSLVTLRPVVLNSLRQLSTTTNILTDPSQLPDEAVRAVTKKETP